MLKKMENMRAAKKRKRLANTHEPEPNLVRWFRFEIGVRRLSIIRRYALDTATT